MVLYHHTSPLSPLIFNLLTFTHSYVTVTFGSALIFAPRLCLQLYTHKRIQSMALSQLQVIAMHIFQHSVSTHSASKTPSHHHQTTKAHQLPPPKQAVTADTPGTPHSPQAKPQTCSSNYTSLHPDWSHPSRFPESSTQARPQNVRNKANTTFILYYLNNHLPTARLTAEYGQKTIDNFIITVE